MSSLFSILIDRWLLGLSLVLRGKQFIFPICLLLSMFSALSFAKITFSDLSKSSCKGRFINPITQINWSMVFPIRIAGHAIQFGQSSYDSPITLKSGLCHCPSHIWGLNLPGILISYHQPLFIEEIVKSPGCLSSLGGISVLPGFYKQQANVDLDPDENSRWQIHWYEYPIFSLLPLFKGFSCADMAGFALVYLTEFDPTWQNDAWSALMAPEAVLFNQPDRQAICAIDALASSRGNPIDDLFWCVGSWGSVYPLTGSANASVDRIQSAELVGAKFIAKLARMGLLWQTVGKEAMCKKQPMHIWIKSQFSIDPVYPEVSRGHGMPLGAAGIQWMYKPAQTYAGYENINQVIFQEQQCCLRP